jgi:hypothetical protein
MSVTGYMKHTLAKGRRKGDTETQGSTQGGDAVQHPPPPN